MIGTKLYKDGLTKEELSACAKWCNETQQGRIIDKGEYWEVEANPYYKDAETQELDSLRYRRNKECFPVINRGALWYDRLNDNQKAELSDWYQAWLDVTETLEAPEKPEWLE